MSELQWESVDTTLSRVCMDEPRDHLVWEHFRDHPPRAGYCRYCGQEITDRRRRVYCSRVCSLLFATLFWKVRKWWYLGHIGGRCEECGELAVDVHHIFPISKGGRSDWSNLRALCVACHSLAHGYKTARIPSALIQRTHRSIMSYFEDVG